jgi:hypothetical protein
MSPSARVKAMPKARPYRILIYLLLSGRFCDPVSFEDEAGGKKEQS